MTHKFHKLSQEIKDLANAAACPRCGGKMKGRSRRSDNREFLGCRSYPECKGTLSKENANAQIAHNSGSSEFTPSKYQLAIRDYLLNPENDDLVVEALAGTGKSTTILWVMGELLAADKAAGQRPRSIVYVAFNKKIVKDFKPKAPQGVDVTTLHSKGFRAMASLWGIDLNNIQKNKKRELAKALVPDDKPEDFNGENKEWRPKEFRRAIIKLASLVQNTLTDVTDFNALEDLVGFYDIAMFGQDEYLIPLAKRLLEESIVMANVHKGDPKDGIYDFDDMIYLPVILELPVDTYDEVFVDECQDLNMLQLAFVHMITKQTGRQVYVGDRYQAIYAFRGALTNAVDLIIDKAYNPTTLPLSVCYRCPRQVLEELVQPLMPSIEVAPNADEGEVNHYMPRYEATRRMDDNSMVLCRTNAPLVGMAYELIGMGKKATILGRDFADNLINLIESLARVGTRKEDQSIANLIVAGQEYLRAEMERLTAMNADDSRKELVQDKIACVEVLTEGCANVNCVIDKINKLFNDNITDGTILSSIHKAKGAERDHIYILQVELLPHPKATGEFLAQELNLAYVAFTRPKLSISFIDGTPLWDRLTPVSA